MRLLRLGNSYEADANIASDQNKAAVAERLLAARTGEQVETTSRVIWPDSGLPELVDRWLDRYKPDIVLLIVSSYWFTNASLPLQIERRFGRLGKPIARMGERAVGKPWLARNPLFKAGRNLARTTVGGATHFTPEQVNERMEECIRRILIRENIALAVRGPRLAFAPDGTVAAKRRSEDRRQLVHRRMRDLCHQLHVEYIGYDTSIAPQDDRGLFQPDLIHASAGAHAEQGEIESEALVAAWTRTRH